MDKDDLWIVEHFSELVTKYAGKHVRAALQTSYDLMLHSQLLPSSSSCPKGT